MSKRFWCVLLTTASCLLVPALVAAPARAQDAETDEPEEAPREPVPVLPAPTVEPDGTEPEGPSAPEEPEEPVILHHIGLEDQDDWQEEQDRRRRHDDDVPFEVPSDTRTGTGAGGVRADEPDPEDPPRTFSIAAGAGFARLLAADAIDFARIEERFLVRIPGFTMLQLGAGGSQMIGPNGSYLAGGGVRIAFGAGSRILDDVDFEFVGAVQPGVLAGTVGTFFDLHAGIDLRLEIARVFQVMASGSFSLVGTTSLLAVAGLLGFVF